MSRVTARLDPRWRARAASLADARWTPRPLVLADGEGEWVTMGAGPPCLLLPPMPGWKEAWVALAPRLATRFTVAAADLRVRFAPGDRAGQCVDDARRALDALGAERALVVGHSLGGVVAQRLALAEPARVAALVLSSTFARLVRSPGTAWTRFVEQPLVLADALAAPLARAQAARGAWVYDPACDAGVLAFVRFGIRRAAPREVAALARLALAHDTRARSSSLAMPVLVVRGERERTAMRAGSDALAEALPRARRVVLPGVGHLHPLSAPDALAAAIVAWWDEAREA